MGVTARWDEFALDAPALAEAGDRLFRAPGLAFLATVTASRGPRVHPAAPVLTNGGLYVAVEGSSPKRQDLEMRRRFMIHALPGDDDEAFAVVGEARLVEDADEGREVQAAFEGRFDPTQPLFELLIDHVLWERWDQRGQPDARRVRETWPLFPG